MMRSFARVQRGSLLHQFDVSDTLDDKCKTTIVKSWKTKHKQNKQTNTHQHHIIIIIIITIISITIIIIIIIIISITIIIITIIIIRSHFGSSLAVRVRKPSRQCPAGRSAASTAAAADVVPPRGCTTS